jgi:glutamine amidotransferase/cyclase
VSIGSDAVDAAEAYYAAGCKISGDTAIEQISQVYGKQAVVVSSAAGRQQLSFPVTVTVPW